MTVCSDRLHNCTASGFFYQPDFISKIIKKEPRLLEFTEAENKMNMRRCEKKKFYDAKICEYLCSQYSVKRSSERENLCKDVCFTITRSQKTAGEVCPFQKYCINGCPCTHYQCEKEDKLSKKYQLVWNVTARESVQVADDTLIYRRDPDWDKLPAEIRITNGVGSFTKSPVSLYNFHSGISRKIEIKNDTLFNDHGRLSK